ncbi:MAG: PHP domain-containing protein [Candidatus Limnocylindrales bacterium]
MAEPTNRPGPPSARVDLHCHTSASFDGVSDPAALVARAAERGLTHVAITDHDTLDGALRARDAAPGGLEVLIGCEVNTREGDLVLVFLERPIGRGLSARDAIAAGREQGAVIGIPHPYDHSRRSLLLQPANEELVRLVDWVEVRNGRVTRQAANERAAALATRLGMPGVGVSDAHALIEVGRTYTVMTGDLATPANLLAAMREPMTIVHDGPPAAGQRLGRLLRRRPGAIGATR